MFNGVINLNECIIKIISRYLERLDFNCVIIFIVLIPMEVDFWITNHYKNSKYLNPK